MKPRTVLSYLWKVPVCGLAFLAGTILGSMLADSMIYAGVIVILLCGSREPRSPVRE